MSRRLSQLAWFAGLGVLGCRNDPPKPGVTQQVTPSVTTPTDRLAPHETAPGIVKAFDLVLPRGSKVLRVFGETTFVSIPLGAEAAASYVRTQCEPTDSIVGPHGSIFPRAIVRGAVVDHVLRIEIEGDSWSGTSKLLVHRAPLELPPLPKSPDEAMKAVGMTPDGKIANPKNIE